MQYLRGIGYIVPVRRNEVELSEHNFAHQMSSARIAVTKHCRLHAGVLSLVTVMRL